MHSPEHTQDAGWQIALRLLELRLQTRQDKAGYDDRHNSEVAGVSKHTQDAGWQIVLRLSETVC